MYRHGGNLSHRHGSCPSQVTWTIYIKFCFPLPMRIHMSLALIGQVVSKMIFENVGRKLMLILIYEAYKKTKAQISAFVYTTQIVQSLYFLNPKFEAPNHFLWLYSPVCVGPGQVFSRCDSYKLKAQVSLTSEQHFY